MFAAHSLPFDYSRSETSKRKLLTILTLLLWTILSTKWTGPHVAKHCLNQHGAQCDIQTCFTIPSRSFKCTLVVWLPSFHVVIAVFIAH